MPLKKKGITENVIGSKPVLDFRLCWPIKHHSHLWWIWEQLAALQLFLETNLEFLYKNKKIKNKKLRWTNLSSRNFGLKRLFNPPRVAFCTVHQFFQSAAESASKLKAFLLFFIGYILDIIIFKKYKIINNFYVY